MATLKDFMQSFIYDPLRTLLKWSIKRAHWESMLKRFHLAVAIQKLDGLVFFFLLSHQIRKEWWDRYKGRKKSNSAKANESAGINKEEFSTKIEHQETSFQPFKRKLLLLKIVAPQLFVSNNKPPTLIIQKSCNICMHVSTQAQIGAVFFPISVISRQW